MKTAGSLLTIALLATLGSAHPLVVDETTASVAEQPAIVPRQGSTEVGQPPARQAQPRALLVLAALFPFLAPAPAPASTPAGAKTNQVAPPASDPNPNSAATSTTTTTTSTAQAAQQNIQPINTNALLSLTLSLFPLNVALEGGEDVLEASNQALADVAGIDTTQNANGPCADMTIVFARGTTEGGNVGTLAGPPMFAAVKKAAGAMTVAVQGVEYPANVQGFLAGGDKDGSAEMAKQVQRLMAACPNTKMTMSGYSQGGQLVHNAAAMLPPAVVSQVSSVVIFGDPLNGQAVKGVSAAKTKVICHRGDNICQGGNLVLQPHLTYSQNADEAAAFIVQNAAAR